MTANPVAGGEKPARPSWHRFVLWGMIFLLGVLLGWWLAPHCPSSSSNEPSALNKGERERGGGESTVPIAPESGKHSTGEVGGGDGEGGGAPKDGGQAGGGGRNTDGMAPAITKTPPPTEGTGAESELPPDPPPGETLTASDFRYDRTGLPRYSLAVSTIASTLKKDSDGAGLLEQRRYL